MEHTRVNKISICILEVDVNQGNYLPFVEESTALIYWNMHEDHSSLKEFVWQPFREFYGSTIPELTTMPTFCNTYRGKTQFIRPINPKQINFLDNLAASQRAIGAIH